MEKPLVVCQGRMCAGVAYRLAGAGAPGVTKKK